MKSCIEFRGGVSSGGYGNYRNRGAHIVSYELFYGYVASGNHVHHTCHNRLCINPDHLIKLTPAGHQAEHPGVRSHCRNGHDLGINGVSNGQGKRTCKLCKYDRLARKGKMSSIWVIPNEVRRKGYREK